VDLGAGRTAVAVATLGISTCALLDDASAKCWGDNGYGELGIGDTTDRYTPPQGPLAFGAGRTVVRLFAGYHECCAVLDDTSVRCWGHNIYGQLGLGHSTSPQTTPQGPLAFGDTGRTVVAGAGGVHSFCALLGDGSIWCWGQNTNGELGVGGTTDRHTPQGPLVFGSAGRTATEVACGHQNPAHCCARIDDGTLWCWGGNAHGQLGDGTTTERDTPVLAVAVTPWPVTAQTLALGQNHTSGRTTRARSCPRAGTSPAGAGTTSASSATTRRPTARRP
jgi:hypothetical protein